MKQKHYKQQRFHIRKGDTVKVLTGDDKGKTGKILLMIPKKNRAIVEGINMITKHNKPSAQNPEGGIEKKEAAMHISNLMLVDPSSGDATRTGRKLNDKDKLQRYSKKTGDLI